MFSIARLNPKSFPNLQSHYSQYPTTFACLAENSPSSLSSSSSSGPGRIKRLALNPEGRTKLNSKPDREFYSFPRFVTHVDDSFISVLTDLYRERLKPGWEVLDLMSSWVSHLPPEFKFKQVIGHGMNAMELSRNTRLDHFFVKDLNKDHKLQMEDCSFDAVICTVSVQYLQFPEDVFADVLRVLRPGGVFIVSFSNRMFYEKAIGVWRDGTPYSRTRLVVEYFQSVEGFTEPEVVKKSNTTRDDESMFSGVMNLLGLSNTDPFYAVIAYRNFKPI